MFNLKSVNLKHIKVNINSSLLDQFFDMLRSFAVSLPIKILFGLLKVLAYNFSFIFIYFHIFEFKFKI